MPSALHLFSIAVFTWGGSSEPQTVVRHEWRASTFTTSAQAEATLDVDASGHISVAWSSRRQQDGRSGVYLQRFSPEGFAIGSETRANLFTGTHQIAPAVACGFGETTWLAWQSHGQDGQLGGIMARRFLPNERGELVGGDEILINEIWRGDQFAPALAVSADGTLAVVWTSIASPEAPPQVRARFFDSTGEPVTGEIALESPLGSGMATPAIASGADGSFAMAVAVADHARKPAGICVQRFNVCGERIGSEFVAAHDRLRSQVEPVIAPTRDGWLVAWCDAEAAGEDYDVVAQMFDFSGTPLTPAFPADQERAGLQHAPAAAATPDGGFVIAWNDSDDDGAGVTVQRFDAHGARIGRPQPLTVHTRGTQALRAACGTNRLAITPAGDLLAAWNGEGGLGDSAAAHITLATAQPLNLAGQLQGVTPRMQPALHESQAVVQLASLESPKPHEPPTFDPRLIEQGEREIIEGGNEIGFTAIMSTGWTPPDPHLAVGPAHIVVMTNGAIAFFDKAGTLLFQDAIEGLAGFWGSLGATNFVFDPETIYDPLSGRFFAMASEAVSAQSKSFILIAVSDDSDPNGTWHKYRIETTSLAGTTYDSPNISVDDNVVYITGDHTSANAHPVFTFNKATMLAGAPVTIAQSGLMPTTVESAGMPPVSFDSPPALYFAEHQEGAVNTQVRLIAMTNPLTGPLTFTSHLVTVPSYGPPEDPPQSGTTVRPETFEARFWSVAYRNGSLWATHHINSARVLARWYEFHMNGWPASGELPTLAQSGTIDPGSGIRTFFNSITVDDAGNAAMTFAQSSPTQFISMQTVYRYASDPPGTFQAPIQRAINTGPYTTNRWGDYSAVNVDPADGHTMWAHHEWAMGTSWRTWVQSFYPGNPCPPDINIDGTVDVDDLLAIINGWGSCIGCSADIAPAGGNSVVDVDDLLEVINNWGSCF